MPSNSIAQITLFDQIENTSLGDLMRLELCLKHIDNDILLNTLDKERWYGRNDFPNKVMWCCTVSQFLFQRLQVNQMRRELAGNPTLRKLVGLNDCEVQLKTNNYDDIKVPSSGAFTNFLNKIIDHQDLLDSMLNNLRKKVFISIPEYGRQIAGDGKYFDSYSPNAHKGPVCKDQRAEHDAKYSKKNYTYKGEDGLKHTKFETHYGFRKHTLVDVYTELPICSVLTPANEDEKKHMTALLANTPNYILKRAENASFDRGYDSTEFIQLIRSYNIVPVIDKRLMRKNDPLILIKRLNDVYYTDAGAVFVDDSTITDTTINPDTGYENHFVRAQYDGYDKERNALIYYYGKRKIRIYLSDDPRTFNEVARDSAKFKRLYDGRTSVERYHGRLDRDFEFEKHTIRGLQKMRVLTTIGDIVMLSLALVHCELGQQNYASLFDFGLW